jgi:ribonuclease HII
MGLQSTDKTICSWEFERKAQAIGACLIAGVDEVGRGPLFGPVVAAAVILPLDCVLAGLNDSKQLTETQRQQLDVIIRAQARCFAIASVDVATIDRINIRSASLLAMQRAVDQLAPVPDFLLIDGNARIQHPCRQQTIIKGDARSLSIAAASVLAKVYRDRMLIELDEKFPGYGLARHKGYGTAEHLVALRRLGPTPEHRRSFAPVRATLALQSQQLF